MKNLHANNEKKWFFSSYAEVTGFVRYVSAPSSVILLLHGLNERGKRIYRKLLPYLPQDSLIIAPNAPFPIQRNKNNRLEYGYSWYFYDKYQDQYSLNQDLAKFWLRDLMRIENPHALPVIIIGFSQGGYLAPLVGEQIPETELVIGLSCQFKNSLIVNTPQFPLCGIHGTKDEIVSLSSALDEVKKLKQRKISVEFHQAPLTSHEISPEVGMIVKKILENYGKRSL